MKREHAHNECREKEEKTKKLNKLSLSQLFLACEGDDVQWESFIPQFYDLCYENILIFYFIFNGLRATIMDSLIAKRDLMEKRLK